VDAEMLTPLTCRFLWGCVKTVVCRIIVTDIATPRRKIPLAVLIATTNMLQRTWHTDGCTSCLRNHSRRNIVISCMDKRHNPCAVT
jgi:hypothetical protein